MGLLAMSAFDARALPPEAARAYFADSSVLSLRPLLDPRWWRAVATPRRLLLALLLWAALLLLHPWAIGASPLPA